MEGGATEGTKIKESRGRKPAFSGNGNEQSVAQIIIKFVRAHLRDLRKNKWVFRCILECDAKADVAIFMKYKDILCEPGAWFHLLAQNSGLKEGCLCIQFCVVVAPSCYVTICCFSRLHVLQPDLLRRDAANHRGQVESEVANLSKEFANLEGLVESEVANLRRDVTNLRGLVEEVANQG